PKATSSSRRSRRKAMRSASMSSSTRSPINSMLTVATESTPGRVRSNNEDSVVWDQTLGLVAVADGMGGHNAGEVASRLALEALQKFLTASASDATVAWPFGVENT